MNRMSNEQPSGDRDSGHVDLDALMRQLRRPRASSTRARPARPRRAVALAFAAGALAVLGIDVALAAFYRLERRAPAPAPDTPAATVPRAIATGATLGARPEWRPRALSEPSARVPTPRDRTTTPRAHATPPAEAHTTHPPPDAIASPAPDPSARVTLGPDPDGPTALSLEEAMRRAAGAPALSAAPSASAAPDARGAQPSLGQVNAALASALPAARACVRAPVRATLTFASTGGVDDVAIPDAEPAEAACVARALRSARVPSFARPTYTVPITVRPR